MNALKIAILDLNTLSCIGLKHILQDIMPQVEIISFSTFDDFMQSDTEAYIHYFVSIQIYMEHTAFFLSHQMKTLVMAGESQPIQLTGVRTLNINQKEKELIKEILKIQQRGHSMHPDDSRIPRWDNTHDILSSREVEVLVLLAKGSLNKEIADKLHISLSTVISHRKNIVTKLGIRSVSQLTIYAVMKGYIEADKI
jgi:DNA-binding NarL/FixJ family response regulator